MPLPTISIKPDEILANHAVTAGYGTAGADIFACRELPPDPDGAVPVKCIFFQCFGGPRARPMLGPGRRELREVSVQVLSRGARGEAGESAGLNEARQIRKTFNLAAISGLVSCIADQSDPIPLGLGDTEVYRWVNNFTVMIDETQG